MMLGDAISALTLCAIAWVIRREYLADRAEKNAGDEP